MAILMTNNPVHNSGYYPMTRQGIQIEIDPPRSSGIAGLQYRTFHSQVAATDILISEGNQTEDSLLSQSKALPARLPGMITNKTGSVWPHGCDCYPPKTRIPAETSADFCMQVCSTDVCPAEQSQTGPSLSAEGPYCPWDYTLQKARYPKGDCYVECRPPRSADLECTDCHCENPSRRTFFSQVAATDINITECTQTGASLQELPPWKRSGVRGLPNKMKRYAQKDLECCNPPYQSQNDPRSPPRSRTVQVRATDICPSAESQVGPSLALGGKVVRSRRHKPTIDDALICRTSTRPHNVNSASAKIQVKPTDIGKTTCSQTGDSLSDTLSPSVGIVGKGVVRYSTEKVRVHARDINYLYDLAPPGSTSVFDQGEKETQVNIEDICPAQEAQTGDSLCSSRGSSQSGTGSGSASPPNSLERVHVPHKCRKRRNHGPNVSTQTRLYRSPRR